MILDAGVLLSIGSLPLLVIGFILFPVAIVGAPLYAGFAWGDDWLRLVEVEEDKQ
jgi:hypothetical protein